MARALTFSDRLRAAPPQKDKDTVFANLEELEEQAGKMSMALAKVGTDASARSFWRGSPCAWWGVGQSAGRDILPYLTWAGDPGRRLRRRRR